MEIRKEANVGQGSEVSREDLERINALAQKELTAGEVFTFSVRLCDNEVDREWERFSRETLEGLAPMFVGKSGIFDHNWSAGGQAARIYKTQVVEEEGVTRAGERTCYLKGWAYMLRTEGNRDLIAEIQGGIKKEVSVGCAVERAVCSVCGQEMGRCEHIKGKTYGGKLCWGELTGAKDAYEWSFVAVPAQRRAGVIKGMAPSLKQLCQDYPQLREEIEGLEKAAGLGRRYMDGLRGEVVRLWAAAQPKLAVEVARSISGKLDEEELRALKTLFSQEGEETWAGGAQLTYPGQGSENAPDDGAFLV